MMRTEEYSPSFQLLLAQCTTIEKREITEVQDWCDEHNIHATFVGSNYDKDIWFVKERDSRILFMLRWV